MTANPGASPVDDLTTLALTLLREQVDLLFAQHDALATASRRCSDARAEQMQAVADKQQAAHTAEDHAWNAWAKARDRLQTSPGDLTALAAADQAEAGYDAARQSSQAVTAAAAALARRLIDESEQDTRRLLDLGRHARATQDAWFAATLEQARLHAGRTDPGAP